MVPVFHLTETQPPPALVSAIDPEFLATCRLDPVPIRLHNSPQEDWCGFCEFDEYAEADEVTLARWLVEPTIRNPISKVIRDVYLHEVAHRLAGAEKGHNVAFSAVFLALLMRSGLTNRFRIYDMEDEPDPPVAFAWAWEQARELAPKPISARELSAEIIRRWADKQGEEQQRRLSIESIHAEADEAIREADQARERAEIRLEQIKEMAREQLSAANSKADELSFQRYCWLFTGLFFGSFIGFLFT